jgi:hypothetical protein
MHIFCKFGYANALSNVVQKFIYINKKRARMCVHYIYIKSLDMYSKYYLDQKYTVSLINAVVK